MTLQLNYKIYIIYIYIPLIYNLGLPFLPSIYNYPGYDQNRAFCMDQSYHTHTHTHISLGMTCSPNTSPPGAWNWGQVLMTWDLSPNPSVSSGRKWEQTINLNWLVEFPEPSKKQTVSPTQGQLHVACVASQTVAQKWRRLDSKSCKSPIEDHGCSIRSVQRKPLKPHRATWQCGHAIMHILAALLKFEGIPSTTRKEGLHHTNKIKAKALNLFDLSQAQQRNEVNLTLMERKGRLRLRVQTNTTTIYNASVYRGAVNWATTTWRLRYYTWLYIWLATGSYIVDSPRAVDIVCTLGTTRNEKAALDSCSLVVGETKHCNSFERQREDGCYHNFVRRSQHASHYPQLGTHWLWLQTRIGTEGCCYATSSCGKASTLQLSNNPGMATFVVWMFSGNSRMPSRARAWGHFAGTSPLVKMSAACFSVSTYSRTDDVSSSKISCRDPRLTLWVLWMCLNFGENPFNTTFIVAWLSSLTLSVTGLPKRRSQSWSEGIPSANKEWARLITSDSVVDREVDVCRLETHANGKHDLGPCTIRYPPFVDFECDRSPQKSAST